jgi:hypothetical protein
MEHKEVAAMGNKVEKGGIVTHNGYYVCAEGGGGLDVVANRPVLGPWETFKFEWLSDFNDKDGNVLERGIVALRAASGQYVCAEGGGGLDVVANRPDLGPWEIFKYMWWPGDAISFETDNGHFLCAEGGGGQELVANRPGVGDWEKFTIKQGPC